MNAASGAPRVDGVRPAVAILGRSPFAAGKTRLTQGLDEAVAAALRAALLLDTIDAALTPGWDVDVYLDPAAHVTRVQPLLADDAALKPKADRVSWRPQAGGDLGARMVAAIAATLASGRDVAVLVGSDLPDLPAAALESARQALAGTRVGSVVALGPAADGGFYLAAATDEQSLAAACAGVTWSQPQVLADVMANLTASGRAAVRVMPWWDVDEPAALTALLARSDGARRTRAAARMAG